MVPDRGFAPGFGESGAHTVIHAVSRRAEDEGVLPECGAWSADDGVVG